MGPLRAKALSPSATLSAQAPESALLPVSRKYAGLWGVIGVTPAPAGPPGYSICCTLRKCSLKSVRDNYSSRKSMSSDVPQDEPQRQRQHSVPLENRKSLYHPLRQRA